MANDLGALLLIYTSTGDRAGLKSLSGLAGMLIPVKHGLKK